MTPADPRVSSLLVPSHRGLGRRVVRGLIVFAAVVLVVDAIVGQKGFLERLRVRRQHEALAASVAVLKRENAALREEARQLREDPAAIEALARKELGLIKPGERLFIIKDVTSPAARVEPAPKAKAPSARAPR
jgi:cell division protein FtsB